MKTREVYSSSSDVLDKDSARLLGREKANAVPSGLCESAPMPERNSRSSSPSVVVVIGMEQHFERENNLCHGQRNVRKYVRMDGVVMEKLMK